jgi:hypothetical protein
MLVFVAKAAHPYLQKPIDRSVGTLNMHKNTSTPRTRAWRSANRAHHNEYHRRLRSTSTEDMLDDPDEIWFVRESRKRKALQRATPVWADRAAIRLIYEKCALLNRRYPGTGFVVHHVIPISHPQVCGLHVADNLKIVSRLMKKKLGRRFT